MAYWAGAQPAMAMSDLLHLNRRGYTRMGMALADALMFDFDGGAPVPDDPARGLPPPDVAPGDGSLVASETAPAGPPPIASAAPASAP
jgi:hypothetical protein